MPFSIYHHAEDSLYSLPLSFHFMRKMELGKYKVGVCDDKQIRIMFLAAFQGPDYSESVFLAICGL